MNRPRPGGLFSDPHRWAPAQAPYAGTLQLHGCNHIAGRRSTACSTRTTAPTEVPFLGLEWYPPKLTGPPWWYPRRARRRRLVRGAPGGAARLPALVAQLADDQRPQRASTTSGWSSETRARRRWRPPATSATRSASRSTTGHPLAGFNQIRWRVVGAPGISSANTYTWPFVVHRDQAAQGHRHRDRGHVVGECGSLPQRLRSAQAVAVPATRPSRAHAPPPLEASRSTGTRTSSTTTSRRRRCTTSPARCPRARTASRSTPTAGRSTRQATAAARARTGWTTTVYIHVNPSVALSVIDS